jgi:ElaB/YqjD/DUF883 family membrane-anchored ribosome-binding protein
LALTDGFEEVPVSSTDVLEANVASIRADLNELKNDFRAESKSLRDDMKSLREKVDKNFERLLTRFDADIKETNKALGELSKVVLKIDSRLSAVPWVGGGAVALVTLAITVGKAFKWF